MLNVKTAQLLEDARDQGSPSLANLPPTLTIQGLQRAFHSDVNNKDISKYSRAPNAVWRCSRRSEVIQGLPPWARELQGSRRTTQNQQEHAELCLAPRLPPNQGRTHHTTSRSSVSRATQSRDSSLFLTKASHFSLFVENRLFYSPWCSCQANPLSPHGGAQGTTHRATSDFNRKQAEPEVWLPEVPSHLSDWWVRKRL